jgi:hypothetical protein
MSFHIEKDMGLLTNIPPLAGGRLGIKVTDASSVSNVVNSS